MFLVVRLNRNRPLDNEEANELIAGEIINGVGLPVEIDTAGQVGDYLAAPGSRAAVDISRRVERSCRKDRPFRHGSFVVLKLSTR